MKVMCECDNCRKRNADGTCSEDEIKFDPDCGCYNFDAIRKCADCANFDDPKKCPWKQLVEKDDLPCKYFAKGDNE